MIHLEIDGERYPIAAGETVIGSASDSTVVLDGEGVRPRHAVVQGMPAGAAAIRAAGNEAEVRVNGVRLGSDPTPLLHGDKIGIGNRELLVVDPTRAGSTQLFDSGAFADLIPPPGYKGAGTRTGGRLVCLTDGREYSVGAQPLSLGRDAGADVVVAGSEVSRLHAEIRNEPDGYILIDISVNGTYVNGERIGKTHRLSRADVIRIGNDEFRFYADPLSAASPVPAPVPESAPVDRPPSPPEGAAERLSDTMHGLPEEEEPARRDTPPSPEAAPLASLLFRTGDFKGRRLPIKVPVVNIGRGDYNDIVIGDPSVSTMHAKLQRREAVWILTDMGSTNGTFVEGERLAGEAPLSPGTTLRFGDVIALFEPLDDKVPAGRSGNTRLMGRLEPHAAAGDPRQADKPRPRPPRRPIRMAPPRSKGPSAGLVMSLLILMAILAYLLLS
ncbi:MAG: transport system ATP-binding/permease protein [Gemmatimonadales bacterium]|nr:transport system ATP-binding/permease protein [Gemmatimonadales bacterium]